jgi:hypothetical protein
VSALTDDLDNFAESPFIKGQVTSLLQSASSRIKFLESLALKQAEVTLTPKESIAIRVAGDYYQDEHEESTGKKDAALTRALKKLDKAAQFKETK